MPVDVLLADDHEVVREGFRALLERHGFRVIGEASDGQEAVRLAQKVRPQVAVLDLSMPLLSGIEASRQIISNSPETKTILLTMYKEDQYILEALRAGVSGYILKTKGTKELVDAIRQVLRGTTYLSPEVSRSVIEAYRGVLSLRLCLSVLESGRCCSWWLKESPPRRWPQFWGSA